MPNGLFLPQLSIRGFRGIADLSIPRLGRVTLLAGKNSVGKTTVLDAVRVYAARGRYTVLYQLLRDRKEFKEHTDDDGDRISVVDWMSLFHGRSPRVPTKIVVGPDNVEDRLELHWMRGSQPYLSIFEEIDDEIIEVVFRNRTHRLQIRYRYRNDRQAPREDEPTAMACESLGPDMLSALQVSRLWDGVALTDDEVGIRNALDLVVGSDLIGVAVVGVDSRRPRDSRRVIVRLKSHDRPISLESLGDGAVRLFGVALALANSRGGFLLIDEAENGIHHTVQRDLWTMILRTAHANDVQVLATTHSWDCVRGFAEAAAGFEDGDGVLVRLDRNDKDLRAVVYSKEALETAAEQGIEVR